jgi:hypothetical protein
MLQVVGPCEPMVSHATRNSTNWGCSLGRGHPMMHLIVPVNAGDGSGREDMSKVCRYIVM